MLQLIMQSITMFKKYKLDSNTLRSVFFTEHVVNVWNSLSCDSVDFHLSNRAVECRLI